MSRFGPDPHAFFEGVYEGAAPWDTGEVQPDMQALIADFPPQGVVLDAGCGSGDLSIHLARLGHKVIGVDFVQTAIDQGERKRGALPPDVAARITFLVADATRPSEIDATLGAVFDSGFLHLLDADESERYVTDLARALAAGGRYYLHAFAMEFPVPNMPRAVTEAELRARFNDATGWRILAARDAGFHNRIGPPVPAIAACIERTR